jgi:hypothetical protein
LNEKGQIRTITYASNKSQFISLSSISGRAKIELLHETENAQYVSQVQALRMGRTTQTNKLHDDFLSLDIFGYQLSHSNAKTIQIHLPEWMNALPLSLICPANGESTSQTLQVGINQFTMAIIKKRRRGATIARIESSRMS